eukprot:9482629-Pyramimonas_sp.AAC.1
MWALAGNKGDPLYIAAQALRRYAWEWWQASEPSQHGRSRRRDALTPGGLSKSFNSAVAVLRTTERKPWLYRTRGPISALLLWLEVGGWHWEGPATFCKPVRIQMDPGGKAT